jgi:chemotaxis protein MotB
MVSKARQPHFVEEEESYYVSMTDLLVGVIFIFVIILMYFALRFQQAEETRIERVNELQKATEARTEILSDLQKALKDQGVIVEIDLRTGTLHLPENVLFESGQAALNQTGRQALQVLGGQLSRILPCYTPARVTSCADLETRIDADIDTVFVEGHTDDRPVSANNPIGDNWRLSAERAISTFKALDESQPELVALRNQRGQMVLSVSGYSEFRPRQPNDSEAARSANRRIDLRVLMEAPTVQDLEVGDGNATTNEARDASQVEP